MPRSKLYRVGEVLFPGVMHYREWYELWKVVRLYVGLLGIVLLIASFVL